MTTQLSKIVSIMEPGLILKFLSNIRFIIMNTDRFRVFDFAVSVLKLEKQTGFNNPAQTVIEQRMVSRSSANLVGTCFGIILHASLHESFSTYG